MTRCRVSGWMLLSQQVRLAWALYPPSECEELATGASSLAGGFWVVTRWDLMLRATPSFTHHCDTLLWATIRLPWQRDSSCTSSAERRQS